jgi:predicted ATP-dependent endonuclease of OLD family
VPRWSGAIRQPEDEKEHDMKLTAFRIKNYRSIVDTGWCDLSLDNITVLIGQNESGKTAILEALTSFSTAKISEDILRSDDSQPEVCCSFSEIDPSLSGLSADKKLPATFEDALREAGRVNLKRTWSLTGNMDSILELEEASVREVFQQQERETTKVAKELTKHLDAFIKPLTTVQGRISDLEKQRDEAKHDLDAAEEERSEANAAVGTADEAAKPEATQHLQACQKKTDTARRRHEKFQRVHQEAEAELQKLKVDNPAEYAVTTARDQLRAARTALEERELARAAAEEELAAAADEDGKKASQKKLNAAKKQLNRLAQAVTRAQHEEKKAWFVARSVRDGTPIEKVRSAAEAISDYEGLFYSNAELAQHIFSKTPAFQFFGNFTNLLPNRIDLADIEQGNEELQGYQGTINFLKVAGVDLNLFKTMSSERILKQKIRDTNAALTAGFRTFWRQVVGRSNKIEIEFDLKRHRAEEKGKGGTPYLIFWIKDGRETLYPRQRSQGVRWFLSFYLQLKAASTESKGRGLVMLIDEPGNSLHARAKEDVLRVFEDIKDEIQIIYTTHSPYLLDVSTVYRVLAVQRAGEDNDRSETRVLTPHQLGGATTDTLTPLYTLMGVRLSGQNVISRDNNIIVEEVSAFYYLSAFSTLCNQQDQFHFLPATGVDNIPALANLLLGWGLLFGVIVDDDRSGRRVYNTLKDTLFGEDENRAKERLLKLKGHDGIEDHFSPKAFREHLCTEYPEGGSDTPSAFLREKSVSKGVLALGFYLKVREGKLTASALDDETLEKIRSTLSALSALRIQATKKNTEG